MKPMQTAKALPLRGAQLDPDTYHDARQLGRGWDVYHLEQEWRVWMTERPRDPDKAFLGFAWKRVEKCGKA